ncbi:MAG: hypothetical protein DA328_08200, partial [Nitrososphaeraceae archaeon]|nr:hypothetical protein [Nitrososphaeraceae archaeon]
PKTSAQAKFNIQKDWQSYRDLMLEEGYFNGNNDSLLQRIRRHTADTLKRNGRLEKALEAKIKNAPTTFELYETAKQLGTFRDLSQKNIRLAEGIKAMAERGKNTEKTKIQGDMTAAQLKKTAQEKIIQDLDRAINSNPSDRQGKQIIDVDQKLQDYVKDTINLHTAAAIANIFVYENKDAANNFLEQGVLIQLITGETLVKVLINGELFEERSIPVDIDTLIDVGVINTIFSYHKGQVQDEIDRLDNAIQDLQQEELRVDRELDVLDNLDFTQTSESFRMANLPEDELPAAVKDYLIKQDIERGEEILKTETTNFQNGIYSTTNLKKIIDYLKLLLNYPSLGANEPAVQQLLADLNILFNQMDTAFKKQIAEGKKFTDEHEGSITEYVKDFSTDPNKPVFIEIIDEIKRLHTVKNDPASDPKDIAAAELKLNTKRNELQNLLSNLNIPEILWELKEFLLTNGAEIDEALIEILTRKSTSKNTQPQAEVIRQNRTLVEYSTSYRLFQGVIKGIPYLNAYLISDRIDSSEFAAVINNMKDTDIDFKTPPSAADFATFKANLLRLFEDYKKARRIEKALRFLNSGVDLTAFYQNAPMPAVFPSPQQQVVMEEAVAFLETKETSKIFVIDGAAGTGKTFLLKLFLGARKVFTWSPYTHADANLQATLNIEPSTVTIQSLLNLLNPKNIPANDITAKFNFVVAEINKIKAGTDTNLIAMVEKLEKGTPLIIDEIYAADVDVQIILAVLAETFKAKVIVLGDPNQISNAHGLANYAWQKIAVAAQHGTPLSVRFRSFVLPIAAVQEAFYGKTSKIDELNTVYNDGLGVNGLEDRVKFVEDIKEKLANGVNSNDCKVIVSDDLVKVYNNLLTSQGITVEVLSVEKAQGREFPYVWVDITKMNVNGIVAETAHNKLVYTAVSRGKLYIGYNNADDRPADQRTKIRSSFDASLTEDIGFKQMLFNANERTYLELLQRRNAPSTRPMPAPIVAPTTTTNTPPPVVPLPVAPVAPASPQRTAIVNSALNKGKIVLNFLKKLKTVIANKINNQTPPPATNNTTTNPPPNNQTTPVPPTTNIPVTNTPIPPTTSNQSEIETKKADIERRRQGLNGVEEIIFSNPNFRLEGFEIDGNYWNVVTSTDRAKVLVNVNGVIVPFYLTTGQAGKGLIPGWYPFFGIGKDGWLNKTDKSDMETYYERYWGKETANIVKSISEELNSFYGTDPTNFKNDGDPNATSRPLTTLADKVEDYINSKLNYTPAINNGDARKTLRSNVEQLGKEINAKYDAELKALEQQPTTSNQSEIEAKKADIERRRQEELLKIGNEAIPKEVQEFINIDNSGKKVKVTYVPVAGKSLAVVLIDWFSRNIPNVKTKNYKFIGDSIQVDITLEGLGNWQTWELPIVSTIGGSGSFIEVNLSEWGKTLINAKYDAELAALEGNKSTTNDEYKLDYLINKTPIKAGVEELFEYNRELANAVYEALGFLYSPLTDEDKARIDNRTKEELAVFNRLLALTKKNNFNEAYDVLVDRIIEAGKDINRRKEYIELLKFQEYINTYFGYLINDKNDKTAKDTKITDVINEIKEQAEKDKIKRKRNEITPQQKQQALQLYSQYLDTIFPDSKVKDIVY